MEKVEEDNGVAEKNNWRCGSWYSIQYGFSMRGALMPPSRIFKASVPVRRHPILSPGNNTSVKLQVLRVIYLYRNEEGSVKSQPSCVLLGLETYLVATLLRREHFMLFRDSNKS
jgi:hypothetical protein